MMNVLTKAEEQVMQVLWKKGEAMLRDVVEAMPAPKPHANTVGTLLKILTDKDFVNVEVIGRTHLYSPKVSKESYSKNSLKTLVKGYFGGNFSSAVSFMVKENNLSLEELEMLLKEIKGKK